MTKRIIAVLCSLVIIATAMCACSKENVQSQRPIINEQSAQIVTDTTGFKLSYTQSDSLSPYESDSLNNHIVQDLVFESLFRIDEELDVQPEIATSYSYSDPTTLNVTIISGLKFSDDSVLDADSVVEAFYLAKKSSYWQSSLEAIRNARVLSATEIAFDLNYPDKYAHRLLTFYIARSTQGDSKFPIGSGRYAFTEGDGKLYVEVNPLYREEFTPRFTKIQLVNVPATDSINNALNIGNISYAYRDAATDEISRLKCSKKKVSQNNLVYLGVNSKSGITANADIRRAISLALDRATVVKSAYQGYAKAATSIYHPSSSLGRQTQMFSSASDTAAAKQAISQSEVSGRSISILVNENTNRKSAATLIKQQLETVGFYVDIKSLSNDAYVQALESESFDLYIGETKLPFDMRLTGFFTEGASTSYGIDQECNAALEYNSFLGGGAEIGKFTLAFSVDMPFIPILYRDAVICYSKAMRGDMQGYFGNYFSNIQDWYYN